ncbi:DUF55-domain-containing protein [Lentinula raphanica]|nr:DUF55-domain-containing protein [Lentinula raphanica]KAJ3975262.1 DUF55-domain-containing protein [Lentinula raphanica]
MLWLLKAEPDSRIVKGTDVKFSVDDFESVKTSAWEGVRNYEARNLMKEMKLGEKESYNSHLCRALSHALFYHSNCKNPGIAAFAQVSKEAYPDHTAWDSSHPYYDPKSDESSPRWFMVDLTFESRAKHFVPLVLLKHISEHVEDLPEELAYIGSEGAKAIKGMDLINRGRLSVQRVEKPAWDAIEQLAERGGWDETELGKGKGKGKSKGVKSSKGKRSGSKEPAKSMKKTRNSRKQEEDEDDGIEEEEEGRRIADGVKSENRTENIRDSGDNEESPPSKAAGGRGQKRKAAVSEHSSEERPATRARTRRRG